MPSRNVYFALIVVVLSLFIASKTSLKEQIFRNVAREIETRSLEPTSKAQLFEGALAGLAAAVGDAPYTAYLPPTEKENYMHEIQGQFAGVGVRNLLKDEESGEFYFTPMRATPAADAGLTLGDRIVAVDGKDVAPLSIEELSDVLRGKEQTIVRLKIRPRAAFASANGASNVDDGSASTFVAPDVFREIELTRALIQQDVVSGDRLDEDGHWIFTLESNPQIGYVSVEQFADETATQTRAALDALEKAGVSSVILDFRGNPGGFLPDAVAICDEFIPVGMPIVETRNRDSKVERVYLATQRPKKQMRVAVLVDEESASASEIVAAALQDSGVAVVVGTRSYGKGTVQSLFEIPCNLGLVRVTTAGFWRPSGEPIHRRREATVDDVWGVLPNPELEIPLAPLDQFFRLWVRYVRISSTNNGALDSQTLDFLKTQTRAVADLIAQESEADARARIAFKPENDDATPKENEPISAQTPFEPIGRAPYYDPQLDRAVDYLTDASLETSTSNDVVAARSAP